MTKLRYITAGGLKNIAGTVFVALLLAACTQERSTEPVDYVNPNMGGISHLLVPTYPTVHLPNSMLRVTPLRREYTSSRIEGLPVFQTAHRGSQAFAIFPFVGDEVPGSYSYDCEKMTPYSYEVCLDEQETFVRYAVSHRSAVCTFRYSSDSCGIAVRVKEGKLDCSADGVEGVCELGEGTSAYVKMVFSPSPLSSTLADGGKMAVLKFDSPAVTARYGVSFIDVRQADSNMQTEISGKSIDEVAAQGRAIWNDALSKIEVNGAGDDEKAVFYTSLYRVYERMVNISEGGRFWCAADKAVHEDGGRPYYTDDWFWDTYLAAHPLRTIIDPETEEDMIASVVKYASLSEKGWLPTFPQVKGDNHGMNCNHGIAVIADALAKGLNDFDREAAYEACRRALLNKTLIPWSDAESTALDRFYFEKGYFPSLSPGETETCSVVNSFEKRQPVAVTLGTAYDSWCLAGIAERLGKSSDAALFRKGSYNYRNLFNPRTRFFHPKDSRGQFIEPFDYTWSGDYGFRDAYDENNGWIYRWQVPHNIADLISLYGGKEQFCEDLLLTFSKELNTSKNNFYGPNPDHSALVGQFSMGNEPCTIVPYLFCYAGKPWLTQKYTRSLLNMWFRNDLLGEPGDEDGGGMSAFAVFSMMGFYPLTPGLPMYVLTSPVFEEISLRTGSGKTFRIVCDNYSPDNKYIQSAVLNGESLNRCWLSHSEVMDGGELRLTMGPRPCRTWASAPESCPPSLRMPEPPQSSYADYVRVHSSDEKVTQNQ